MGKFAVNFIYSTVSFFIAHNMITGDQNIVKLLHPIHARLIYDLLMQRFSKARIGQTVLINCEQNEL